MKLLIEELLEMLGKSSEGENPSREIPTPLPVEAVNTATVSDHGNLNTIPGADAGEPAIDTTADIGGLPNNPSTQHEIA
jgi:hypothetical protein